MIYRPARPPASSDTEEPPADALLEQGGNVDVLFDFFDFVDTTADGLNAYIHYRCSEVDVCRDVMHSVYESVLKQWRRIKAKNRATLPMLIALADRELDSVQADAAIHPAPPPDTRSDILTSHPVPLSIEDKTTLRMMLLNRYKKRRRMAMMMLLQTAVLLLAIPTASLFAIHPPPLGSTARELAAVEVLLSTQERETIATLTETESSIRSVAAHYAEDDVSDITVELAVLAFKDQVRETKEVNSILEQFGSSPVAFQMRTRLLAMHMLNTFFSAQ